MEWRVDIVQPLTLSVYYSSCTRAPLGERLVDDAMSCPIQPDTASPYEAVLRSSTSRPAAGFPGVGDVRGLYAGNGHYSGFLRDSTGGVLYTPGHSVLGWFASSSVHQSSQMLSGRHECSAHGLWIESLHVRVFN